MLSRKPLKLGAFFDATPLDHAQAAILIVFHRVSLCLSRALSRPANSIPFT
uniref:Uncharacterized protein n=1 Tax=Amphimedon queenslandica TaxID=400682 RepID=A0A1X7U8Z5_AMPQE